MGKKKTRKKIKQMLKKVGPLSIDDLLLAGMGTLEKAAKKNKKKIFTKAQERGQRVAELEMEDFDYLATSLNDPELSEPVIAYTQHGGGWFNIEVNGTIVDRIRGEEQSAARAGELLEGFAAGGGGDGESNSSDIVHSGGGWYQVVINGVPIDKIQGREPAEQRLEEIRALN